MRKPSTRAVQANRPSYGCFCCCCCCSLSDMSLHTCAHSDRQYCRDLKPFSLNTTISRRIEMGPRPGAPAGSSNARGEEGTGLRSLKWATSVWERGTCAARWLRMRPGLSAHHRRAHSLPCAAADLPPPDAASTPALLPLTLASPYARGHAAPCAALNLLAVAALHQAAEWGTLWCFACRTGATRRHLPSAVSAGQAAAGSRL